MKDCFLGIDTSNYKTSIAVTDINRNIIFQRSEYLLIKNGEKGLRQSDAFFQHSNKLPELIEDMFKHVDSNNIAAIGVSTKPRRVEGSYMPCFVAGVNFARILSATLNLPLHDYSHQEGHAAAILEMNDSLSEQDSCLFFHLSGGTTEFLRCTRDNQAYKMEILGGTKDISIGQLIDRLGVNQEYPFPAGKYMDDIACSFTETSNILPNIDYSNSYFNLSGIETKLLRYADAHTKEEMLAVIAELFNKLSKLLYDSSIKLALSNDIHTVCLAGGVASSRYIRDYFGREIPDTNNKIEFIFADPELSGDNAVGISLLTSNNYR